MGEDYKLLEKERSFAKPLSLQYSPIFQGRAFNVEVPVLCHYEHVFLLMIASCNGTCSVIIEDHGKPTTGSAVVESTSASETPVSFGLSGFSLVKT
jgi:hypothetical protein